MLARAARFSTHELTEEQRSSRWEEWNRRALVGLTCRTPSGRGLRGEEVTLSLPTVTLAHVRAERHTIRRTSRTVDTSPTHSMVVYAVLHGRTTFTDSRGSQSLGGGDAVVVDGDRPFERTFATDFAELAVKIPWHAVDDTAGGGRRLGASVSHVTGLAALRIGALSRQLLGSLPSIGSRELALIDQVALDLVTDLTTSERVGDRLALAQLLIEQSLGDPLLSASRLAAVLEISERQLSRLFAHAQTSFPEHVTQRRMLAAIGLLDSSPELPVGEISARCGYSSPAYFSRVFRAQVGVSPQQFRSRDGGDPAGDGLYFSAIAPLPPA